MAIKYIPPEHHAVRYVPWAKLRKDEEDNVIGVLPAAFHLREREEYLSATWLEHCGSPTKQQCIQASVNAIRTSELKPTTKSGFAIGNVGAISELLRSQGHKVRFVHESEPDNVKHIAIRLWPEEADELFDVLAVDTWAELVLNKDIP